jgi:hypothetical protein
MLAVRIVAGLLDFELAALVAHFLKVLAGHAQVIFQLRNARARLLPLLLHFDLARGQAFFFYAQAFELYG